MLLFKTTNLSESRIKAGLLEFYLFSIPISIHSSLNLTTTTLHNNYNSTTTVNGYISLEMGQKENFLKNTTPPCYQNKSKLWEDIPTIQCQFVLHTTEKKKKRKKIENFQPFSLFSISIVKRLRCWIELTWFSNPLPYFISFIVATYYLPISSEKSLISCRYKLLDIWNKNSQL